MEQTKLDLIKANGKSYKLKIGELIRFETEVSHYYFLDGQYLPGVTTILQEASPTPYGLKVFWQNNTKEEADAIFESAGDFGSRMHEAFELLLQGEELDLLNVYPTAKEKRTLLTFQDWFTCFKPTEFQPEQALASKKYQYAGTLDFVGMINGERWLIDFKTSNAIHMSHQLQVLAYKQAYEESYGIKIDRVGVVRFGTSHKGNGVPKEGKLKETGKGWEFREVKDYKIEHFMNIYNTYLNVLHGGVIPEPPEIAIYPEKLKLLEEIKKEGGVK